MTLLQHLIKNMTNAEVAFVAGHKESRGIDRWRKDGKPSTSAMLKLSAHFGKTVNELLSEYKVKK